MVERGPEYLLLCDARLSSDARILGLFIAAKGDGYHEISRAEFEDVLSNETSRERVQRAIGQLERYNWVHRIPGGRGHYDRFEFRGREIGQVKDSYRETWHLNADSSREIQQLNAPDSRKKVEDEPPVSPLPPVGLDPGALEVIEQNDALLRGCRSALKDYLAARVPRPRQKPYVWTVVAWLQDADPSVWRKRNGGWLAHIERTAVLATAFNELGAANEHKRAHDPGDPINLKNKLRILVSARKDDDNSGTGSDGRRTGRKSGAAPPAGEQPARRRTWGD